MMRDGEFVVDLFMDVVYDRPPRVSWTRPAIMLPMLQDCATAMEKIGYTTSVGVVRDIAYLVARRLDGGA